MTVELALRVLLMSIPAIASKVGERISPMVSDAPLDKLKAPNTPFITYQKISGSELQTKSGGSGLQDPMFQITVWSDIYSEAVEIAEAIKQAARTWRMETIPVTENDSLVVESARLLSETDTQDMETAFFGRILDIGLWHRVAGS